MIWKRKFSIISLVWPRLHAVFVEKTFFKKIKIKLSPLHCSLPHRHKQAFKLFLLTNNHWFWHGLDYKESSKQMWLGKRKRVQKENWLDSFCVSVLHVRLAESSSALLIFCWSYLLYWIARESLCFLFSYKTWSVLFYDKWTNNKGMQNLKLDIFTFLLVV